jgi:3-hydroxybutyryl-CoA dehydrogenase
MKTIGVVGAGAMGSGIAQLALARGHAVVLSDAAPGAVAAARRSIAAALAREIEKGRLADGADRAALNRLTTVDGAAVTDAFSGCGLVIEAIVERLESKQSLFRELDRVASPSCILATNTSSLSVTAIASVCEHPERVVGMHFFNPAPVMPLVEIIAAAQSADRAVADVRALADEWGKVTVRASDTPGFIVNRVARPFYGESLQILEEGLADPATIDWAMRELGGFRMGPFLLMDFIGHDVNYAVTESVWTAMYFDPRYRPSLTQRRLVEAGWLGRKSGRGFYDYHPDAPPRAPREDRASGEAIVHRVVAMLVNEAVDAVHWQVATPVDVDLAVTRGVNYPRGLLSWGNDLGLQTVLEEIERLRAATGDERYRASPLLRRMVAEGRRFFE